jgi:hypothetical protein
MMQRTGFLLAITAAAFMVPGRIAFADEAPSKRTHDQAAAEKVTGRLLELGLTQQDASSQVSSLTTKDLNYFAADPGSRIQVVAGLWREEWLFGLFWATVMVVGAIWAFRKSGSRMVK